MTFQKAAILGVIRHVLTFGGGLGVSGGYLTESDLTTAVAAIITLAGLLWSVVDKALAEEDG